jgi:hypothetical protein
MIERVTQQIPITTTGAPPYTHVFYFPRASVLEYQYRVKPANFTETAPVEGVELTFGIGSPPDFGLGPMQSNLLALPQQFAGIKPWEEAVSAANVQIANLGHQLEGESLQLSNLKGVQELVEKDEPGNFTALYNARAAVAAIDASIAQTEGNKKLAEAALAKLHLEAPEGWTPYVTSTFQRAYDALRVTLLCPTGSLTFTLEQTLVVARPEDIGPTYTQPLATAGR